MKRHLLLLITAILLSATSAFAQDCDYSGTTGSLNWCLKDGTLTISGQGAMPDYGTCQAPWFEYRLDIHSIVVETGVTSIGNYSFELFLSLTSITIPNSVTTIGDGAFSSCSIASITIPNGLTSIGDGAFNTCGYVFNYHS